MSNQNFRAGLLARIAIGSLLGYFAAVQAHTLNANSVSAFMVPPAAPSNLKAVAVSPSRLELAWVDNSSNEIGFKVERKKGPAVRDGAFAEIVTLGANATSFVDSSLSANTKYFYRVHAYNASGFSSYTNDASATTWPNPIAVPSALTAQPASKSQINLSWIDNSDNENGFRIERKLGNAGVYAQIAAVGANVTSFADTGLAVNTKYFYRLRAFNAGGPSAYSAVASAVTLPNPPSAPSQLSAVTISSSQINLAWVDRSSNETGFRIERKIDGESDYTPIATIGANVKSFSSLGLNASTKYFYRVCAYNLGGSSAFSNEASATTLPSAPVAPSGLKAVAMNDLQIKLTWQDQSTNEDSFKIERKTGAGGAFAEIAQVGPEVKNHTDAGLNAVTPYFYRVRASNRGGHSAYSNEAGAMTLPKPPAAPSLLTATATGASQIDLAWTDNANDENGLKIERKKAQGEYEEIATVGADQKSYADAGLSQVTEYFYRIRAYNANGHSIYSNVAKATTLPAPPATPENLTAATVSDRRIDLAWMDHSDTETGFKIERKSPAVRDGAYAEIAAVGANVKNFADSSLAGKTAYSYRVRAFNAGGNSDYSNEANATTLPGPPAQPGRLTATAAGSSQIALAWIDNSDDESGFKIERKTAGGAFAEIALVNAEATSYADIGLSQATEYFYRVRAYSAFGHSGYSDEANATTLPAPPTSPSNLIAKAGLNTTINLTWADKSNNEAGFKIERKIGATGVYAEIAPPGGINANVRNFTDSSLSAKTLYFYRVRAFNAGGQSNFSNEASATSFPPPPAGPSGLTAVAVGSSQITLAWADNAKDEIGFRIERRTPEGEFTEIVIVGANTKSYTDIGLSQVTQYFYRLRAYNAYGYSGYSNEAGATTLPVPPAAPVNLTATTVSNRRINLAWADNSNNEDGFTIERKIGAAGAYLEISAVSTNVKSFADSSLAANSACFYRVRAFNAGGPSAYSNEANAVTLPNRPAAPNFLTATAMSHNSIRLAWTDNSFNEAGFKIERKIGAGGVFAEIAPPGGIRANVTSFVDTGLLMNTEYFYRMRAYNAGGFSAYSNQSGTVTLPITPGNLTATTLSNRKIRLAWVDSSDNETGFKIERKTSGGAYVEIFPPGGIGADVTSLVDSNLAANSLYFYRARAFNAGGNTGYSNEASATTLPNPPLAPSSLIATAVSHRQISLAWADNSFNETGFRIERKIGAAGGYSPIATVGANVTNYLDFNLVTNTEYFYRVTAFNIGGSTGYSNESGTVTLPLAPGNVSVATVSNRQLNITWADSSNNESGFKIERKTSGGAYVEIVPPGGIGANVTSYSDSSLAAISTYFYRVRAFNAGGHSAYSNEATAATLPNPPAAPFNLTAVTESNRVINLAWNDNSGDETGFKIERKITDGAYAEVATVEANVTSRSDTSLAGNTAYFYRVRAFNAGGHSVASNEASATTRPDPPPAPSSLTATVAGSSQINLTWLDNSDDEDGFKIESKSETGAYAEIATVGANVSNYSHLGLAAEATYFYRIRAFNTGGVSPYSNEASATPSDEANLALKKPALASITEATSAASRAVDGNLTTFWNSGAVNVAAPLAWLRVELEPSVPVIVDRVVVKWQQTYFAKEYLVQLSSDGVNWTTVYANNSGIAGAQEATFALTPARYVRLFMKKNNKASYRVAELEAYFGFNKARGLTAKSEASIPSNVMLAQNYPNPFGRSPFNPATTISYALPKGAKVTLKVINLTGQEVATLVEGYKERGIYHVTFNARKLPSGVYYAVLQAGEARLVRRMVLAK
jgi:titin